MVGPVRYAVPSGTGTGAYDPAGQACSAPADSRSRRRALGRHPFALLAVLDQVQRLRVVVKNQNAECLTLGGLTAAGVHRVYDFAAFCLPWSGPSCCLCSRCYRSCYG